MSQLKSKNDLLEMRSKTHNNPEIPVAKEGVIKPAEKKAIAVRQSNVKLILLPVWRLWMKRFIKYVFIDDIEAVRSRREEWMKSFEGMNIEKPEEDRGYQEKNS